MSITHNHQNMSKQPRMMLTEWYDLDKVHILLEKLPSDHHDTATLRHIASRASKDGFLDVTYRHGCGFEFGRVYARQSFQTLTTDVRNIVSNDKLIAIDIDNCYPTLLLQIFQKNGIDTPKLNEYVTEREQINQIY